MTDFGDTVANLNGQMQISWLQVGYGNWSMTSSWFSLSSSSNGLYIFHEQDNGLGEPILPPGDYVVYVNSEDAFGNATQSQSAFGSANSYAFTSQQIQNGVQRSSNSTSDAAGSDVSTHTKSSTSQTSMFGQVVNGITSLHSLSVYQSVASHAANDGFSDGSDPSTVHIRSLAAMTVNMSGSSASGTGQKTSTSWSAVWGTETMHGHTSPWGDPAGVTSVAPPVDLSWPQKQSPPPPPSSPPPPQAWGNSGNWLLDLPPQPTSGPQLVDQFEANYQARVQMEANGQTPPPMMWGTSVAAYGSDGNQTFAGAMVQSGQLIQQMSQYALLPLKFLPGIGQVAMLGSAFMSVVQGNFLDAAFDVAFAVNPCGLVTKALAAYGVYSNVVDMIDNGVSAGNVAGVAFNLLGLFGACFTGEMLVDTEGGKKRADEIQEGDLLWSRNEFDPDGPLMLKVVEERFVREAPVLHVRVADQVLRTTGEHPFWVENQRRWLPARELKVGDQLRTRCGSLIMVEGLEDWGQVETVYNWRIADYHTYFVSATEDGVSVWAHNACTGEDARAAAGRNGGVQIGLGRFLYATRRAARQAASEIAGNLGTGALPIRLSDFRGGPSWAANSNRVIGRQSADGAVGWRDDFLGHPRFGAGPHVNVWGPGGIEFHLFY